MRVLKRALRPLALTRVAWLAAVSVWLVVAANYLPEPVNLALGTRLATSARTAAGPLTQARLVCAGPETLGVEGLAKSPPQEVSVTAASAPVAALPSGFVAAHAEGSLTIGGLPTGGKWAAPIRVRGQVVSGQVSTARSALVTGTGALAPGTVATQWSWTKTGNSRGLVTAPCLPPAASSWLIAGGAAPGPQASR